MGRGEKEISDDWKSIIIIIFYPPRNVSVDPD